MFEELGSRLRDITYVYPFSTCLHGAYELITMTKFRTICSYLLNSYGDIFSLIYFIRACAMQTGKPRAMHALGQHIMTYRRSGI